MTDPRRRLVHGRGLAEAGPGAPPAAANDAEAQASERWLVDTPLLQHTHPKVRLTAKRLTQLKASPREQALACFQYVRALPYAAILAGASTSAPAVLRAGRGDCHTKTTLLVALLRSLGIPARMRVVTLGPGFLHGITDLGSRTIEHAYAEVLLDGRWVATDAYAVDPRLAAAARARLRREQRRLGYGVHVAGTIHWDARNDAFGQFSPGDAEGLPLRDWGAFDDPSQFYAQAPVARLRLSLAGRLRWLLGTRRVNRRVKKLRAEIPSPAGR